MTSLKIYISPAMEKLEHQIGTEGKHHQKGSIGYSTSGGKDVITS